MNGLNPFDAAIMGFVQTYFHNPVTDTIFPIITYLGEAGMIWILIGVTLLFFKKTRLCGFLLLVAMLGGFLTGEVFLKNVICRPRPCHDFPNYVSMLIPIPGSYSFPSGHSASSFAAATVLFYHFKKWGIAAYVLAFLIAFSRIFLFVHYPTDVLAGTALGFTFAAITLFLCYKVILPAIKNRKAIQ